MEAHMLIVVLLILATAWLFFKVAPAILITLVVLAAVITIVKEVKEIFDNKKNNK